MMLISTQPSVRGEIASEVSRKVGPPEELGILTDLDGNASSSKA
jgi:hypothetical protein